jgi:hypothetical protein
MLLDSEAPNDFSTPQILRKQERENYYLSNTVFANTTFTINGYLYWQCQCLMGLVFLIMKGVVPATGRKLGNKICTRK